jgi:hypothetical protein
MENTIKKITSTFAVLALALTFAVAGVVAGNLNLAQATDDAPEPVATVTGNAQFDAQLAANNLTPAVNDLGTVAVPFTGNRAIPSNLSDVYNTVTKVSIVFEPGHKYQFKIFLADSAAYASSMIGLHSDDGAVVYAGNANSDDHSSLIPSTGYSTPQDQWLSYTDLNDSDTPIVITYTYIGLGGEITIKDVTNEDADNAKTTIAANFPNDAALTPDNKGNITWNGVSTDGKKVTVTFPAGTVQPGDTVYFYIYSNATYVATAVVGDDLKAVVDLTGQAVGTHKLAVFDANGAIIGWEDLVINADGSIALGTGLASDLASISVVAPVAVLVVLAGLGVVAYRRFSATSNA